MDELEIDIRMRVACQLGGGRESSPPRCTGCGSPLEVHQPDPDISHRLLGCCSCEECGVWFALVVPPDREGLYLIRLPSVVEMIEAISRAGERQ